jgi:hypothetical protein
MKSDQVPLSIINRLNTHVGARQRLNLQTTGMKQTVIASQGGGTPRRRENTDSYLRVQTEEPKPGLVGMCP